MRASCAFAEKYITVAFTSKDTKITGFLPTKSDSEPTVKRAARNPAA
jgi:hypothetical protein